MTITKRINSKNIKSEERKQDCQPNDNEGSSFIPERIYLDRDSLLTDLLKTSHFNAIFNLFFSFIIMMFINTLLVDWITKGIFQHYHHILWVKDAFAEPIKVILTILVLYFLTALSFGLVKVWIGTRLRLEKFGILADLIFLLFYLCILFCVVLFPVLVVMSYHIPPCTSAFIVYEQVRIFMKIHAYVRFVVPKLKVLINDHKVKDKTNIEVKSILNWQKFLYFCIIPTLIYRDSYPKRKDVNYSTVLRNFSEFILCIIFVYYIFINLLRPIFIDFSPSYMKKEVIIPKLFQAILPTILMLLTLFYCFLHSWLNGFAELTKFGDRQFYKDWWNATSLSDFLRTWNVLIHDWLYTYVYKDVSLLIYKFTNNRKLSKSIGSVGVLLFSSMVHEYILAFCFKFFYPVLLTVYFLGGSILYFIRCDRGSRIPNILVWTCLQYGNTIFLSFYTLEWYARQNCIRKIDGYVDFFVPRSLFCELK